MITRRVGGRNWLRFREEGSATRGRRHGEKRLIFLNSAAHVTCPDGDSSGVAFSVFGWTVGSRFDMGWAEYNPRPLDPSKLRAREGGYRLLWLRLESCLRGGQVGVEVGYGFYATEIIL
jgi:hypothetical protein